MLQKKKKLQAEGALFVFIIVGTLTLSGCQNQAQLSQTSFGPQPINQNLTPIPMQLFSPAFQHNQNIPSKYTCDGENLSPPLKISNVPVGAKSLALIVDDPDAPAGDWVHWVVWNIDPLFHNIPENTVPGVPSEIAKDGATQGTNDFGKLGWGGPCPPSGAHRYQFKLYALDDYVQLDSSAKKADLEKAMQGHILEQTILVGLYRRS